jgi:DNA repair protein RecN (Recombination protein N)
MADKPALMLKQLTIQNYVLVEHLDISFSNGLTTITGESGAGKSILLGAVNLLLGERARSDTVRPGANKADISAEFAIHAGSALQQKLVKDELIDPDAEDCLLRRVISAEGRSRAFVNAVPVTLNYLKEIGDALVEIQGQNEHQRLADRNVQRALLDDYANQGAQSAKVKNLFQICKATEQRIQQLQDRVATQDDRKELLSYQLQEFNAADLQIGELEQLEQEQKRLAQAQQILASLNQAQADLEALDNLRSTARTVAEIDDEHPQLNASKETLTAALSLLDDAGRDLRHYQEQVVVDPQALADIDARLQLIFDLARKHRVQPEQLVEHAEILAAELAGMTTDSSELDELLAAQEQEHQAFIREAQKLSKARRKHSKPFCQAVEQYMHALGIAQGALSLVFHDHQSEHGLEQPELHVTTNEKFAPGPLNRIASGGEQTRISLAIQIVAAANSALPCLVLDEADVGVGGTTADMVGRILRDLAVHTQVICVTHAPQVAALGQSHMRVSKSGDHTDIQPLSHSDRVEELARMLAGADVNAKARDYAQELLSQAAAD